ncbi:MAG: tetratricopeptide repeat protein [Chloroflexi bacterium]|nr:tetratricopeptide repeat protein [Chloroflexota bacterium]
MTANTTPMPSRDTAAKPEDENTLQRQASSSLPRPPIRGFVGRIGELHALEQALAADSSTALISITGSEGNGKTALAAQAARNLAAQGVFRQVVYSNFAGGGGVDAALWELYAVLPQKVDPHVDNTAQLKQCLADSSTLILWDHLEALLPEGDAPVVESELRTLLQFGVQLSGAGCKLLIISDKPLPGFNSFPASLSLPELGPLTDADARELLQAVSPPALAAEDADRVLKLSYNQPIAIQALAALLHHFTPVDLYTMIEQVLPGSTTSGIWSGQQAHEMALSAIWQTLSVESRESLYGLGIFLTGGMERLVNQVEAKDAESWRRFLLLTTQCGLIYQEQVAPLAIPYLHLHPALLHFTQRHLAREARLQLNAWYCASYLGLLKWIHEQEKRSNRELLQLLWIEMPNFRRAFALLASSQQLTYIQEYSQALSYAMDKFGLQREIEFVGEVVRSLMQAALPKDGPLARNGVLFMLEQVQKLLDAGKGQQAVAILQPMCQRIEKDDQLAYKGDDAKFDRARANHLLGKALVVNNKLPVALAAMLRALTMFDQLTNQTDARTEMLELLLDLTDLLLTAREIDQAKKIAERGLLVAADLDDKEALGKLNYRLALITQQHQDHELSQRYASQALDYYQAAANPEGQAEAWRHLAMLSVQRERADDAIQQLNQALELARQASNKLLEADILVRLGTICTQKERPNEAEANYILALGIYQDHHFKPGQASTEVLLSELLLNNGQAASARIHAEAARALVEGAGPGAQPWAIFDLLERIATAEGDSERALMWRRRTRESFTEAPQAEPILMRWRPILRKLAAACNGETLDEETLANLDKMEAEINNPELFNTIWRILGGERGSALYEPLGIGEAVVIKRLLDGIEHPAILAEAPGIPKTNQTPSGFSVEQFISAVKAAQQGDAQAITATENFIQMLESKEAPQTLHDFAAAIRRILAGERGATIADGLPDELAQVLQTLIISLDDTNLPAE